MSKKYTLLTSINRSEDVRKLPQKKLAQLSCELREFLIHTISEKGGHFGSNLGVVELTVALHSVFNTPKDAIVWDVGHQAYAHKVLTGRREKLYTIRQKGGLSPFPKRSESVSDAFGTGHSSTSISAAVGMALAHSQERGRKHIVAVIGDGALTGGMAFEALNHAGDTDADILVVLNDNRMSISPNVGSMTKYLTRLITSPEYINLRLKGRQILMKLPKVGKFARLAEKHAKGMVVPSTLFEEMGFDYYGPVDGNNVQALVDTMAKIKNVRGPRLLHVVTRKGKGCSCAEDDALNLHAISSFNPVTGKENPLIDSGQKETYTDVFSRWIVRAAKKDKRLHAITPAMREGSGLVEFDKKFPKRFHDVGIAEQHAVTFSAGLACEKKKPVVAIYSTFLQRAYDQLIHDVAIQNLDVLFAVDRAGIVGPDGATHAGSFDLSYLRAIPNMVIMAPAHAKEMTGMLNLGYSYDGPAVVRYPRSNVSALLKDIAQKNDSVVRFGRGQIVREGKKLAILSFGALLGRCVSVAEKHNATLVNMRFVKPLDEGLLRELAKTHDTFVTVEENALSGGVGSAVGEFVLNESLGVQVRNIGIPDAFLPHGTRDEVLDDAGLSERKITKSVTNFV